MLVNIRESRVLLLIAAALKSRLDIAWLKDLLRKRFIDFFPHILSFFGTFILEFLCFR